MQTEKDYEEFMTYLTAEVQAVTVVVCHECGGVMEIEDRHAPACPAEERGEEWYQVYVCQTCGHEETAGEQFTRLYGTAIEGEATF